MTPDALTKAGKHVTSNYPYGPKQGCGYVNQWTLSKIEVIFSLLRSEECVDDDGNENL